jgi:hypothetical protein
MTKQFLVKSTPQIVEIIDSVLNITECADRSKLVHQLLLPYILDVIDSDKTKMDNTEIVHSEVRKVFDSYYESI